MLYCFLSATYHPYLGELESKKIILLLPIAAPAFSNQHIHKKYEATSSHTFCTLLCPLIRVKYGSTYAAKKHKKKMELTSILIHLDESMNLKDSHLSHHRSHLIHFHRRRLILQNTVFLQYCTNLLYSESYL